MLVIVEVTLRTFPSLLPEEARLRLHWQEVGGPEAWFERATDDPDIGYLYKANDTGRISRGDFSFVYHTDEHGFRNPNSPPNSVDVVIVGDSMAFGYGVEYEATWVARLKARNPEMSFQNLGMIGAAPQQYLRILKRFGMPLSPGQVLFVVFPGNDIDDAGRFQNWLDSGRSEPFLEWRAQFRGNEDWIRRILDKSFVAVFMRSALKTVTSDMTNTTLTLNDGNRLQLAPTVYQRQALAAETRNADFGIVIETVEEAKELVESAGSDFLVVLMPTKEEVYLPTLGQTAPIMTSAFRSALEEKAVDVLDLTPQLVEAAQSGNALFFEVDGHPNGVGYNSIADAIDSFLLKSE